MPRLLQLKIKNYELKWIKWIKTFAPFTPTHPSFGFLNGAKIEKNCYTLHITRDKHAIRPYLLLNKTLTEKISQRGLNKAGVFFMQIF